MTRPVALARRLVLRGPRHGLRYLGGYARALSARRAFRRRAAGVTTRAEAMELVSSFTCAGLRVASTQVRSEISALLDRLEAEPPRTVLEIGSAEGGTLFLVTRAAAPDALVVTVDLPRGLVAAEPDAVRSILYGGFARGRQRVRFVSGNSQSAETRSRVERELGGRELDFLFIDGDHSYEGVARDFELYEPLVRSGGLVAFHDIVPYPELPEAVGGVPRFWQELKQRHEAEELVGSWDQGGFGIGLIRKA